MKVKTAKGLFNPAEDSLVVRGTFNNWSGNADLLTDPDGDTVYTITKNYLPAGETTEFKFVILKDNQDIWESISNRSLVFPEGTASYNFYFDNDSVITAQAQVTFNVNMRVKILKGDFVPSSDLLVIRGNFNGWSGLADQLSDPDGDSIYSITKTFNVGDNLEFKFVIHRSGTDFWEDAIPNRTYTVQPGTNVYNGGYFNNDSIYVPRVPIQFTFSCNMELERLSGRFNPATDTVSVNGTFNGWASKGIL
jgi:Starch binding domain.